MEMNQDVQKGIRTDFFNYLTSFDNTIVSATGLQGVLAKTWGQLQVLFENDTVEVVHFINPLTIVPYLESATISMQTAFGMNYIEDFVEENTTSDDLFDCEYTSVDAVINEITVFTKAMNTIK